MGSSKETCATDVLALVPQKLCAAHRWFVRSQLSGFSQQYISGLEQGQRNPTVVTLYELALAVGAHTARSAARRAGGSVVIAAKSGAGGVCHSRYELPPLRYPIICTQVQILGVQHALPSVVREVRPTIVARFRPHHLERTKMDTGYEAAGSRHQGATQAAPEAGDHLQFRSRENRPPLAQSARLVEVAEPSYRPKRRFRP